MTAQPRTLHVCHITNLKSWSGVPTRLLEYLQHRQSDTLRHFVISTSGRQEIIDTVRDMGIPIYVPPRSFSLDPRAIWHIARWLRQHQIDIIHSRGSPGNCWGGLAARLVQTPVKIAGEHGMIYFPRQWKWAMEPWIDRTSDLVVANSAATKCMLMHRYKVPADQVRVVYNAVHVSPPQRSVEDVRAEWGISKGHFLVGNVARLETLKDHFTLIEAARRIVSRRDDVQFVIVGGGELEAELRGIIAAYGLQGVFHLAGWRRDIPDILPALDVFVSTSISEPLGNSLIEAMITGLPVIAPAVDGIPEYVVPDETGLLLLPTEPVRVPQSLSAEAVPDKVIINGEVTIPRSMNPDILAQGIIGLLDNPERRSQMGRQAQAALSERFAIQRYVQEIEAIYLQLAQSKGLN
jgi:glycosyltransferase involved in cell wall biosynthesis